MGRSKRGFLDRGEQKKIKAGSLSLINHSEPKQTNYLSRFLVGRHRVAPEYFTNARHAVVDTRRPAIALTRRLERCARNASAHPYADRPDESLDVGEAIRRLRECFPFVGLQERWGESLWLFSRTMRGAAPFSAERAAVNTRPGAYDREMKRHLDDYADRDTELYAAAVQIYEERLAAARQGKTCI